MPEKVPESEHSQEENLATGETENGIDTEVPLDVRSYSKHGAPAGEDISIQTEKLSIVDKASCRIAKRAKTIESRADCEVKPFMSDANQFADQEKVLSLDVCSVCFRPIETLAVCCSVF
mmetsp:Transcript_10593/g.16759  ORF Transcript_10593/g.16759 Transcript_10593/m.16759 type:complete len:119 (+) Transcript_10593:62-418(+)